MAYRLKPNRSLSSEVRRVGAKQLARAIAELRAVGTARRDDAVHEARRHVKKVRALLRLVQPALGDVYYAANRRLRAASRLLAPIADGASVVDTFARLDARTHRLSRHTAVRVRAALVERQARVDRKATLDRILGRTAALLRAEEHRVAVCELNSHGFHAIGSGLEDSVRRLRRAAKRAAAVPTAGR